MIVADEASARGNTSYVTQSSGTDAAGEVSRRCVAQNMRNSGTVRMFSSLLIARCNAKKQNSLTRGGRAFFWGDSFYKCVFLSNIFCLYFMYFFFFVDYFRLPEGRYTAPKNIVIIYSRWLAAKRANSCKSIWQVACFSPIHLKGSNWAKGKMTLFACGCTQKDRGLISCYKKENVWLFNMSHFVLPWAEDKLFRSVANSQKWENSEFNSKTLWFSDNFCTKKNVFFFSSIKCDLLTHHIHIRFKMSPFFFKPQELWLKR